MIKRVKIFANSNVNSNKIKLELKEKLESNGFVLDDEEFDLGIAVGGDGSFLRMVRATNFDESKFYIGVNAGTLGFAQEVSADELDDFIEKLKNDKYKVEEIGIAQVNVFHNKSVDRYYALNDITIRDYLLNTTKLVIKVEGRLFENFAGDGILISTSFGSTAYNLSFGGSVIYNTLHTLQVTPIAPLNSVAYRNFLNSLVVPQDKVISIEPNTGKSNLIVTVDGENIFYENVEKIETFVGEKRIKCLREESYNFIDKVKEKFLM